MKYIGIVVDRKVFEPCPMSHLVDVGVAVLPLAYFLEGSIPNFKRPESWLDYMYDRLSWPGMRSAEEVICKVC